MTRNLTAFATAITCCLFSSQGGFAQKLVDPSVVAPQYREAAEKRRAEQIRQRGCAQKADAEKVLPRERTSFLLDCVEMADKKEIEKVRRRRPPLAKRVVSTPSQLFANRLGSGTETPRPRSLL